jgi:hypothetical protein
MVCLKSWSLMAHQKTTFSDPIIIYSCDNSLWLSKLLFLCPFKAPFFHLYNLLSVNLFL